MVLVGAECFCGSHCFFLVLVGSCWFCVVLCGSLWLLVVIIVFHMVHGGSRMLLVLLGAS